MQAPEQQFLPAAARASVGPAVPLSSLTARERQVIELVAEGLPNKLISRRLSIEVGTVKAHLTAAFGKLAVQSRTQAMRVALGLGMLPDDRRPSIHQDLASLDDGVGDLNQHG
jgi:DNA-binding NarL/FixJ family response regulator